MILFFRIAITFFFITNHDSYGIYLKGGTGIVDIFCIRIHFLYSFDYTERKTYQELLRKLVLTVTVRC